MWILFAIIALIVFGFIAFISTPQGKGFWGEFKVKWILGKSQPPSKYVFNNIKLVDEDKSIQIDHVVVSKKGILVIETKNISGSIYGQENQTCWTQVLAGGHVKNKLYNPVKQNASHCYHIRKIVSKNVPVISLVVFVQNNIANISAEGVIGISGLRYYLSHISDCLTEEEVVFCATKIEQANLGNAISTQQHIENIHTTQIKIEQNICPRCGGSLVKRNGKYGNFYGCSNYPKCKFTKKD